MVASAGPAPSAGSIPNRLNIMGVALPTKEAKTTVSNCATAIVQDDESRNPVDGSTTKNKYAEKCNGREQETESYGDTKFATNDAPKIALGVHFAELEADNKHGSALRAGIAISADNSREEKCEEHILLEEVSGATENHAAGGLQDKQRDMKWRPSGVKARGAGRKVRGSASTGSAVSDARTKASRRPSDATTGAVASPEAANTAATYLIRSWGRRTIAWTRTKASTRQSRRPPTSSRSPRRTRPSSADERGSTTYTRSWPVRMLHTYGTESRMRGIAGMATGVAVENFRAVSGRSEGTPAASTTIAGSPESAQRAEVSRKTADGTKARLMLDRISLDAPIEAAGNSISRPRFIWVGLHAIDEKRFDVWPSAAKPRAWPNTENVCCCTNATRASQAEIGRCTETDLESQQVMRPAVPCRVGRARALQMEERTSPRFFRRCRPVHCF
jgi:hypothetical protein